MLKLLPALLALTLTACGGGGLARALTPFPNDAEARRLAAISPVENVRFCEYEAEKAMASYSDGHRTEMVTAMRIVERRAGIFISCLNYRNTL